MTHRGRWERNSFVRIFGHFWRHHKNPTGRTVRPAHAGRSHDFHMFIVHLHDSVFVVSFDCFRTEAAAAKHVRVHGNEAPHQNHQVSHYCCWPFGEFNCWGNSAGTNRSNAHFCQPAKTFRWNECDRGARLRYATTLDSWPCVAYL